MFGKEKRSPSSSPSLTLHSTHPARRRSPFGMVRALEKASDGLSSLQQRSPQMSAGKYATLVQDVQVSTHPIVGQRRRSGTDTVLRMDRARVLICDPIAAVAVERMRAGGLQVDERAGLSLEELE